MPRPDLAAVPAFYHGYIDLVASDDVMEALKKSAEEGIAFFGSVPDEKWNYRYAEGKWNIKEILQHVIDAERIFGYRALSFARNDSAPLPGFDENKFAAASKADKRSKEDLLSEFEAVRRSSQLLFSSFDGEQLNATGTANQNKISVRAIGFIIAGHLIHHVKVVKERYLN